VNISAGDCGYWFESCNLVLGDSISDTIYEELSFCTNCCNIEIEMYLQYSKHGRDVYLKELNMSNAQVTLPIC